MHYFFEHQTKIKIMTNVHIRFLIKASTVSAEWNLTCITQVLLHVVDEDNEPEVCEDPEDDEEDDNAGNVEIDGGQDEEDEDSDGGAAVHGEPDDSTDFDLGLVTVDEDDAGDELEEGDKDGGQPDGVRFHEQVALFLLAVALLEPDALISEGLNQLQLEQLATPLGFDQQIDQTYNKLTGSIVGHLGGEIAKVYLCPA